MSKFIIELQDGAAVSGADAIETNDRVLPSYSAAPGFFRSLSFRILAVFVLLGLSAVGVGYGFWSKLRSTPQYSLALLIDAARDDNTESVNEFVDIGAVVDDFMPQVSAKAVSLYGRGLPDSTIQRISTAAAPLLPAVKDLAKSELPKVIRERTGKFQSVPFPVLVIGASRYLDITVEGDVASVKSKLPDHPFEIRMRRGGDRWRVVGVTDEQLATKIAQKVGQDIIAVASKGGINAAGEKLGVKNLSDILKQVREIYK